MIDDFQKKVKCMTFNPFFYYIYIGGVMKYKIIEDIKTYLIQEKIYTEKDEMILVILENTYNDYLIASKDLKKNGLKIETIDFYASVDLDGYSRCMTCPIERE